MIMAYFISPITPPMITALKITVFIINPGHAVYATPLFAIPQNNPSMIACNKNVFVLFKDVMQIKECKDKGIDFEEVTLGNVSTIDGRKQVYKSTGFTEEEAKTLLELRDRGMKLYFQGTPNDKKESLDVLKNAFPGI